MAEIDFRGNDVRDRAASATIDKLNDDFTNANN